jgi:DNA-binding transcriptional LysR family regulator
MRDTHPLVKLKQISLRQLEPYPLALPEPDTTVRQLFDIACNRQRIKVEAMLTSSYITSLLGYLRHAPLGITICGEISVREQINRRELVALPLKDRGLDLRNIEVQTLIGRTLSRPAVAFLDYLKTQLAR